MTIDIPGGQERPILGSEFEPLQAQVAYEITRSDDQPVSLADVVTVTDTLRGLGYKIIDNGYGSEDNNPHYGSVLVEKAVVTLDQLSLLQELGFHLTASEQARIAMSGV